MTTPTTERETVLGILRELLHPIEVQESVYRHIQQSQDTQPTMSANAQNVADAYQRCARLIQQRIDAIEREGEQK